MRINTMLSNKEKNGIMSSKRDYLMKSKIARMKHDGRVLLDKERLKETSSPILVKNSK